MAEKKVSFEELQNLYNQNLGQEGAEKVIKGAIAEAGLIEKREYTREEAFKICGVLKNKGGYIKIIANLFAAWLILHKEK